MTSPGQLFFQSTRLLDEQTRQHLVEGTLKQVGLRRDGQARRCRRL